MTVTYTAEVATSSLGCFLKLLLRWKGSIYKLLWKDFLIFLAAYYALSFLYRFALDEEGRVIFESVSMYCNSFNNLIPVAFILGFYISIVVNRWWDQFNAIPWPDRSALFVTALIHGHDERGRLMRRTIMRYMCLSFTLTLSAISSVVKKRFPTLDHITESGIMLPNEQTILEEIKTPHSKYFIPLVWATSLISRARKEGRIQDDFAVKTLIDEINSFRGNLGTLFNYDWISIPLVYTQVVTLAVYTFFLSCLMGRQFIQPKDGPQHRSSDFYIPIFTLLQFLFYMGWLKVAETLVNPFGEDDDDFEVNWVIDRNMQVSYLVVDEMHNDFPELIRDAYWDEVDFRLPYTVAAESSRVETHLGSTMDINVEGKQAEFVPLESIQEDELGWEEDADGVDITDKARSPRLKRQYSRDSDNSLITSGMNIFRAIPNMLKRSNSKASSYRSHQVRGARSSSHQSVAISSNLPSPKPERADEDIFRMELDDVSVGEEDYVERRLSSGKKGRFESQKRHMLARQRLQTDTTSTPSREAFDLPVRVNTHNFGSQSTLGPESPSIGTGDLPSLSSSSNAPLARPESDEIDGARKFSLKQQDDERKPHLSKSAPAQAVVIEPCRPSPEKTRFDLSASTDTEGATNTKVVQPTTGPAVVVKDVDNAKETDNGAENV